MVAWTECLAAEVVKDSDSGYILKIQPTRFAGGFSVERERKRRANDDSKDLGEDHARSRCRMGESEIWFRFK